MKGVIGCFVSCNYTLSDLKGALLMYDFLWPHKVASLMVTREFTVLNSLMLCFLVQ